MDVELKQVLRQDLGRRKDCLDDGGWRRETRAFKDAFDRGTRIGLKTSNDGKFGSKREGWGETNRPRCSLIAAEQQRTIACWSGGSRVDWKEDAESALIQGPVAGQLVPIDACHFDGALIIQPNVSREDWTRPDQGEYRGCEQAHSAKPEIVKPHDHPFRFGQDQRPIEGPAFD